MPKIINSQVVLRAFLFCCVLLSVFVRWRLQQLPLERDEGEYAYAGQVIQRGSAPYIGVSNMKFPGTYVCYALIEFFFGQTISAIRLSLLALNLLCIALVYLIAKKWFGGNGAACMAAGCYCLLTLSTSVEGLMANAEQFVILFALCGILLMQKAVAGNSRWHVFISAVFFALAIIMKQQGAVFIFFAALWLMVERIARKESSIILTDTVIFAAGIIVPFLVLTGWLYYENALRSFYELTFLYARDYVSQYSWSYGRSQFKFGPIFISNPLIWILCWAGMITTWFLPGFKKKSTVLWLLAAFSFLGVMPGFYFRPHYFNLILPAAAFFAAAAYHSFVSLFRKNEMITAAILSVTIFSTSCYINRDYYFKADTNSVSGKMYYAEPFLIAPAVSAYIRENSLPTDYIAIIGSEPEIYFYSQRRSATSLMYLYPLLEKQRFAETMRTQFFSQIDSTRPAFFLFQDVPLPWYTDSSANQIINFYHRQIASRYILSAVAEYMPPGSPQFREATKDDSVEPQGNWRLLLFRRKDN